MKLYEAVNMIRDYCSKTECENCVFRILHKNKLYGEIWYCRMVNAPYEWEVPTETNIYDIEEVHENCTVQILRNSLTGETSVGWWKNGN